MRDGTDNVYARWLERRSHIPALHEPAGQPAERLLQAVWHHQRLRRDALRTCTGQEVRILHPGFWNREAGPDFRGAVLQLGSDAPRTGDVEVDLHSRCWRQHGHDRNPSFAKVALHVVWESSSPVFVPTLELKPFLDAPVEDLAAWLGTDAAESYPRDLLGRCAASLQELAPEALEALLRQAAQVRLTRKGRDLEARARQTGWEQALWEGMLRALGYKHNAWPMLRVGELRPLLLSEPPASLPHLQARLFGVSGLLPSDLGAASDGTDRYVREVWDWWWRERDQLGEVTLPAAAWRLHGLRPANHPLRRLALAANWWNDPALPPRLDQWFTSKIEDRALDSSLLQVLQPAADPFWSWHWTLRGRRLAAAQPLIGPTRITDLAVNILLPWFWARAGQTPNLTLQAEAQRRYFAWPAAQDNSVLRLARHRLLGGGPSRLRASAARQQGLLQIVRDFCDHSDPLCTQCPLPDDLVELTSSGAAH